MPRGETTSARHTVLSHSRNCRKRRQCPSQTNQNWRAGRMINHHFTSLGLTILLVLFASSPLAAQRTADPAQGEPIGKRIIFADGSTLDVDDAWKQADNV